MSAKDGTVREPKSAEEAECQVVLPEPNVLERANAEAKAVLRHLPEVLFDVVVWTGPNYLTGTIDTADRLRIVREVLAVERNRGNRCVDGSYVHDFKGQTSCPSCGFIGITTSCTAIPEQRRDR
jgi:hypothetical protein